MRFVSVSLKTIMQWSNKKRVPMKWIPFADSVAVSASQGEELFFLGGGFLVGFEEGLLDVGGDELVTAVLWLPTEVEARLG